MVRLLEAQEISVPPTPEIITIEENLSKDSVLKLETIKRPELEMSGVAARWGQRYKREEVDLIIEEVISNAIAEGLISDEDFNLELILGDTGFDEIYRVPESTTPEDACEEEMRVAQILVHEVLALNEWEPEEVKALYLGGSPLVLPDGQPYLPDYGHDYGYAVAQATGLTHLDPEADIHNYYLACNGGGRALKDALINEDGNTIVMAKEGLTKHLREFDIQIADPLSLRFFSDGAAAIGLVPGKSFTYLLGESIAVEDKKGALASIEPWKELVDRGGDLIQVVGNTVLIRLPLPPGDIRIWMKPFRTTKLFLRNVPQVIEEVYGRHQQKYPEKEIKMIVAHHPSLGVILLIGGKLEKRGITVPMRWVINDGNSSGATTLIALVRQMKELNPGDHVMVASFGAGISADVYVIEVGGA